MSICLYVHNMYTPSLTYIYIYVFMYVYVVFVVKTCLKEELRPNSWQPPQSARDAKSALSPTSAEEQNEEGDMFPGPDFSSGFRHFQPLVRSEDFDLIHSSSFLTTLHDMTLHYIVLKDD